MLKYSFAVDILEGFLSIKFLEYIDNLSAEIARFFQEMREHHNIAPIKELSFIAKINVADKLFFPVRRSCCGLLNRMRCDYAR